MKILNKKYFLKNEVLLGKKNYSYKIKSLLLQRLYYNFIYDFEQTFLLIEKAIQLIFANIKFRNNIFIFSRNFKNKNIISKIMKICNNIFYLNIQWVPGSLSNYKQFRKFCKIKINKLPNLVISLSNLEHENLDILEESSSFSIPTITFFPIDSKYDNLFYPITGGSLKSCYFFEFFFLNCIFHGFFLDKKKFKNAL